MVKKFIAENCNNKIELFKKRLTLLPLLIFIKKYTGPNLTQALSKASYGTANNYFYYLSFFVYGI